LIFSSPSLSSFSNHLLGHKQAGSLILGMSHISLDKNIHPREQRWNRHFRLNGALIEGITSSGRATVALLHLNDAERVAYRLGLIDIGHYPAR
jgi:hypothetical protein